MKRYIFVLIITLLVLPSIAGAVGLLENVNLSDVEEQWQDQAAELEARRIERLHADGARMIERRVLDLGRAKSTLASATRVSESIKNDLTAKIEANITGLNALKEEVAAETELEPLRELVKSIINDYRIYAVFLPQTRGLAVVDRARYFADKLAELNEEVEAKITKLSAAGIDVSAIQAEIASVEADLTAIESLHAGAEADFAAMKITDVSGSTSLKLGGKQKLVDARAKGKTVLQALKDAIVLIKQSAATLNTAD